MSRGSERRIKEARSVKSIEVRRRRLVSRGHLLDLELVSALGVGSIIVERLGADEVVVRRGRSDDVAVAG